MKNESGGRGMFVLAAVGMGLCCALPLFLVAGGMSIVSAWFTGGNAVALVVIAIVALLAFGLFSRRNRDNEENKRLKKPDAKGPLD